MAIMPFLAIREYFMAHVISIHARILFSRHKNLIFGMLPDGGVYEDIIDYSQKYSCKFYEFFSTLHLLLSLRHNRRKSIEIIRQKISLLFLFTFIIIPIRSIILRRIDITIYEIERFLSKNLFIFVLFVEILRIFFNSSSFTFARHKSMEIIRQKITLLLLFTFIIIRIRSIIL